MEITVTFRHTEPIESLKSYAVEKISKFRKYLDSPLEAQIVLSVEKFRHQADVTLNIDGTRLKAVEETGDMYSAIDQVMDKVEIQLKRHMSRLRDRRTEVSRGPELSSEETEEAHSGYPEEPVIEVERMVAKPMDPEEAAMQLQISKAEFMVFRNARTNEVNVIYKKKGGNLGLIEPAV